LLDFFHTAHPEHVEEARKAVVDVVEKIDNKEQGYQITRDILK